MPLTPSQSFMKSPAVRLNDDQRKTLEDIKQIIDKYLSEKWDGGPFMIQTPFAHTVVVAHLMRLYSKAGWSVAAQALDGAIGKAMEILQAGGNPQWALQFTPRWFDEK